MPILPDYPGVSWIQNKSPGLPYLNLPDKSKFGYFFLSKIVILLCHFTRFGFNLGASIMQSMKQNVGGWGGDT